MASLFFSEKELDQGIYKEILLTHQEEHNAMFPKGYLCFLGKHSSHTAFALNKWANENKHTLKFIA